MTTSTRSCASADASSPGVEVDVERFAAFCDGIADDRDVYRAVDLARGEFHDDLAEVDVVAARLGRPVARPPRETRRTAVAAVAHDQDGRGRVALRDVELRQRERNRFRLTGTLDESSTTQVTGADAEADPRKLVTLAHSLTAHVVSKDPALGGNVDQIALWPSDTKPTHLIFCNEEGTGAPGDPARHDRDG